MKRTPLLAGAGLAAAVGLRRTAILDTVPASLPAREARAVVQPDLSVAYYVRGPERERPVVLVHSVNAAASAAEVRPLFDRLSRNRRALALDLLGYGRSSRPRVRYTPRLMTAGIVAVLDELEEPADVVALSLGCEFAARAALDRPDKMLSLTFISPTGLGSDQGRSFSAPTVGRIIRTQIVGEAIYGLLASRASINYFLGKSFVGPVDLAMANAAHLTARHRNARFAPASFLEGALFTPGAVRELYDSLTQPVLVIADQDPYTDFGALDALVARKDNWRHERLTPNLGLPHFEKPDLTAELISSFQSGTS